MAPRPVIDQAKIEAVARALCAWDMHDPDEPMPEPGYKVGPPYVPYWRRYEGLAVEHVLAFEALNGIR